VAERLRSKRFDDADMWRAAVGARWFAWRVARLTELLLMGHFQPLIAPPADCEVVGCYGSARVNNAGSTISAASQGVMMANRTAAIRLSAM
jgi:hypothetical protein